MAAQGVPILDKSSHSPQMSPCHPGLPNTNMGNVACLLHLGASQFSYDIHAPRTQKSSLFHEPIATPSRTPSCHSRGPISCNHFYLPLPSCLPGMLQLGPNARNLATNSFGFRLFLADVSRIFLRHSPANVLYSVEPFPASKGAAHLPECGLQICKPVKHASRKTQAHLSRKRTSRFRRLLRKSFAATDACNAASSAFQVLTRPFDQLHITSKKQTQQ